MKGKTITVLLCIFCIVLGIGIGFFGNSQIRRKDSGEIAYLEYGDYINNVKFDLPEDAFNSTEASTTLVMYLSNSCSSCIEMMQIIDRIICVFGSEHLDYTIIWYDDARDNLINKYGLDSLKNYSLNEKLKLAVSTPTFFLIDETGKIIFKDINLQNVISKLVEMDISTQEELIGNANDYILTQFTDSDFNKEHLIYFYMPGCPDCEDADEIISTQDITDKFNITYIYKYDTADDGNKHIDKYKLFASVYGISWYPSFLKINDNSYEIIGQTDVNHLLDKLLD